jgi:ATP-dependent Clp protease ATP-binding subunit ClpB
MRFHIITLFPTAFDSYLNESIIGRSYEDAKTKIMDSLKNHFRPEFLNRLDEILIFDTLTQEVIRNIVRIQLEKVRVRLLDKEINVVFSEDAITLIGKEGYDPHYGARPLKRIIQNKVLNPVAEQILSRSIPAGTKLIVGVKDGKLVIETLKPRGRIAKKESPQTV